MTRTQTSRYAPRLPGPQRREQLLDATLHLIAEGGFEAATMAAVAREAGVSKPVLYEMFQDRAALLSALLEREDERNLTALAGVLGSDPLDGASIIRAYFEMVVRRPDSWKIVLLTPHSAPIEVRDRVEQGRAAINAQVAALIGADPQLRDGPLGTDTEIAAHMIIAIAETGARLILASPQDYPIERLAAFAAALVRALRPSV